MASLQQSTIENHVQDELLIANIKEIHASISKLKSLRPSKQVNALLSHLVKLCIPPSTIDVETLPEDVKIIRESLINLSGTAEGLLELEFATHLTKISQPLNNLNLYPYYENYTKLVSLEYNILKELGFAQPKKVAFVGSGPMPLTSLVLATHHMKFSTFDNFDLDETANDVARRIVSSDGELERRMKFETRDVMEVREELGEYDCIFLAALVGMTKEEKVKIVGHLSKYMKQGGVLLARSARGARAFLYPVVEEVHLLGFEILSVLHPTDEVINSIILARKPSF